jgi:hypothetical protein
MHLTYTTFSLTSLLFFTSLPAFSQNVKQISSNEYECKSTISPKLPEFIFDIFLDTLNNRVGVSHAVSRIQIRRADKNGIVQTLKPLTMYQAFLPYHFEIVDMNFDGYQDILLQYNCGVTGNGESYAWLYKPKTGRFKYDSALSQITSAIPHPDTRTITSLWVGGLAGGIYDEETYQFENGTLTRIRYVSQDYNEKLKAFLKTTKLFKNNKLSQTIFDTTRIDTTR